MWTVQGMASTRRLTSPPSRRLPAAGTRVQCRNVTVPRCPASSTACPATHSPSKVTSGGGPPGAAAAGGTAVPSSAGPAASVAGRGWPPPPGPASPGLAAARLLPFVAYPGDAQGLGPVVVLVDGAQHGPVPVGGPDLQGLTGPQLEVEPLLVDAVVEDLDGGLPVGVPADLVSPPRGEGRTDAAVSAVAGHAHLIAARRRARPATAGTDRRRGRRR